MYSNKELLLKNVIPLKRHFISWTLTGIYMKDRSEKYIVTNPADYDKYSDMKLKSM